MFAAWAVGVSAAGVASVLELGIGSHVQNEVARLHAIGSRGAASIVMRKALVLVCVSGVAVACVGVSYISVFTDFSGVELVFGVMGTLSVAATYPTSLFAKYYVATDRSELAVYVPLLVNLSAMVLLLAFKQFAVPQYLLLALAATQPCVAGCLLGARWALRENAGVACTDTSTSRSRRIVRQGIPFLALQALHQGVFNWPVLWVAARTTPEVAGAFALVSRFCGAASQAVWSALQFQGPLIIAARAQDQAQQALLRSREVVRLGLLGALLAAGAMAGLLISSRWLDSLAGLKLVSIAFAWPAVSIWCAGICLVPVASVVMTAYERVWTQVVLLGLSWFSWFLLASFTTDYVKSAFGDLGVVSQLSALGAFLAASSGFMLRIVLRR
jgi:hypothetical protein